MTPGTGKVTAPAKPTKLKAKNKKSRKLVVSWKAVNKANGYQVVIAQNKKFSKAKIQKSTKAAKYTFKKLKKKKVYYVRVRAFTNSSNGKVYGKWTAIKKIKIKK
ncbi:MAG: fibronectin type III domain-containing protein [Lachnoclostridium sp.]|jgi:hypothetical protein|nr:fibronectin type III domain-containing protein [Lachnoclostridium sp.]